MSERSGGRLSAFAHRLAIALLCRWKLLATRSIRRRLGRIVLELDRRGFVFISNNCIAGQLYELANLEKRSPTAGLYFADDAYDEFLGAIAAGNMDAWSHLNPDMLPMDPTFRCPVWDRGTNNKVIFLHYADAHTAVQKWTARFSRLKDRTPIVIATLRAGLDRNQMEKAKDRFAYFTIMEPSHSLIDNDGLDRSYLIKLNAFLENVIAGHKAD